MTPTRAGVLGLAAVGTTVTLLSRLFAQALRDIDVDLVLDPSGSMRPGAGVPGRPGVTHR